MGGGSQVPGNSRFRLSGNRMRKQMERAGGLVGYARRNFLVPIPRLKREIA